MLLLAVITSEPSTLLSLVSSATPPLALHYGLEPGSSSAACGMSRMMIMLHLFAPGHRAPISIWPHSFANNFPQISTIFRINLASGRPSSSVQETRFLVASCVPTNRPDAGHHHHPRPGGVQPHRDGYKWFRHRWCKRNEGNRGGMLIALEIYPYSPKSYE